VNYLDNKVFVSIDAQCNNENLMDVLEVTNFSCWLAKLPFHINESRSVENTFTLLLIM